jgi:signal recognition particle receptor subunit beta
VRNLIKSHIWGWNHSIPGSDVGKTSFIRSLSATAVETSSDESSTGEKSVILCSGSNKIKFIFVQLPSDKFMNFFLDQSTTLPKDFCNGQGVAVMFSHADFQSREPCRYWLNFLSNLNQDGKTPPIVVVGNKADLKEGEGPQGLFAD